MVITGGIGTGKTIMLKKMVMDLPTKSKYASIFNTKVDADEFLNLVLCEFNISYDGSTKAEKINRLNRFFIDQYAAGNLVLLIIDEAQNLSLEVLEELRLLSNLQTDKDFLFQTILVGQPELNKKLDHPRLAQFAQRIAVRYHLEAMSQTETSQYIIYRLRKAGYTKDETLFTDKALELVYKYSKGIPRLINLIGDQALVYACGKGLTRIDDTLIEHMVAERKKNSQGKEAAPIPKKLDVLPEILKTIKEQIAKQNDLGKRLANLESMFSDFSEKVNRSLPGAQEITAEKESIALKNQLHALQQEVGELREQLAESERKADEDATDKKKAARKLLSILSNNS
jgi:general secretion pathway protein A